MTTRIQILSETTTHVDKNNSSVSLSTLDRWECDNTVRTRYSEGESLKRTAKTEVP